MYTLGARQFVELMLTHERNETWSKDDVLHVTAENTIVVFFFDTAPFFC